MRYRIFEAGESDIGHGDAAAVAVGRSPQGGWRSAVQVAGLPASVSAQDVANFLEGAKLRSGLESITFSEPASGTSRAALVELADEAAQQIALSRDNQHFGASRLQVVPRTSSESAIACQTPAQQISLQSLPAQQAAENIQQAAAFSVKHGLPGPVSSDGSTLKLRGLPYSATVADVLRFFQGIGMLGIPQAPRLLFVCLSESLPSWESIHNGDELQLISSSNSCCQLSRCPSDPLLQK